MTLRTAARQDHHAFDIVAELPDIPGPDVGLQYRHRILADLAFRQACGGRYLIHEIVDQFRDVLAAFRQRRDADRHHRQAMIEILAETTGGNLLFRLRAVEEMMRTSTWTLVVPPARWNV